MLDAKPVPHCQECKSETKELFEKVSKNGVRWVCKDCRSIQYNRYDFPSQNTKKKITPKR